MEILFHQLCINDAEIRDFRERLVLCEMKSTRDKCKITILKTYNQPE
jgi:hypothetical protein